MKIYIMAPDHIILGLVETFKLWAEKEGHEITNTLPEADAPKPSFILDAQQRWRDMQDASVGILYQDTPSIFAGIEGLNTELGIMMGWARQIIILGGSPNVFTWLPWVVHAPWDPTLASVTEAMKILAGRLGTTCQDEGCPHYGTAHSHPKE